MPEHTLKLDNLSTLSELFDVDWSSSVTLQRGVVLPMLYSSEDGFIEHRREASLYKNEPKTRKAVSGMNSTANRIVQVLGQPPVKNWTGGVISYLVTRVW